MRAAALTILRALTHLGDDPPRGLPGTVL